MKQEGSVELVTSPLRREHGVVREQLAHVHRHLGQLVHAAPAEQRSLMVKVLHLLRQHVLGTLRREEAVIYRPVESLNGGRLTAMLLCEHRIIARWLDDLDRLADRDDADVGEFVRRGDQLLGLVLAHLESEEQMLLPLLERLTTVRDRRPPAFP
jgi:hemerythrin-like domain-containing protein